MTPRSCSSRRAGARAAWIALALAAGCAPPGQDSSIEFHVPVTVRAVGTGSVEDRIVATGSLRALESVALRADTSGVLRVARSAQDLRLAEGDEVRPGQLIAEITGEEVKLAARTAATRQRHDAALADYKSKKRLYDEGLISELELRPAETALAEAKLELERSELTESRSRLTTPIGGVILRMIRDERGLPIADGQLVAQGVEIAQIGPTDTLIADVDLIGPDVARVRPGMPARVRHDAGAREGVAGRLVRLAPAVDPTTRTLRAEVRVANPENRLRPGMFVEVTLIVERRDEVPVVPRDAVAERGSAKVVFVLDGQKVDQREVTLGLGDDEMIEVLDGVAVGDRVVVRGLETLVDQTKVRVTGA
jgi:RND family efflux transporter MFP subunit